MKTGGWIKLHRKVMESRVWQNHELFFVWVWCLLRANHKGQWVSVFTGRGATTVHIEPGQFVFGRFQAAEELGMKASSVRNRMAKLKDMGNLDIEPDTHFSIVTILKWEEYQKSDGSDGQATGQANDTQRTANGQSGDTNKNDKNRKNGKKKAKCTSARKKKPSPLQVTDLPAEVQAVWPDWVKHRKEIGHPLKPTTTGRQIEKLLKYPATTAAALIEQSITQGWQGLFELKGESNGKASSSRKGIGPSAAAGQQFDEPEQHTDDFGPKPSIDSGAQ